MSWEDNVRKVVPYTPGEQPQEKDIIKLNTNECPYPPAPEVKKLAESFKYEDLRLYPDPQAGALVSALSDYYHVPQDQIYVGVGSDDVLAMAFLTFFNSDRPVLFPDITYSFYDVWAGLYRIPYRQIPIDENFRIRREDYYVDNGGVIFPNPNAPTGIYESTYMIEDVLEHNRDVVVIIDEAYIDFGSQSVLPLIEKYDNLLVVQTFSKSRAMAGMRIGFAFGSKKLIKYLQDARFSFNSYTMNLPSLKLGVAAVRDDEYFKDTCRRIISTRERTAAKLRQLGFSFPDSSANFIFAKHEKISGQDLFDDLKAAGIYVRHWNAPRIKDYLRITIGTDAQMDRLISFLKKKLGI
jgi:histidinol-phosphate aminotransferase